MSQVSSSAAEAAPIGQMSVRKRNGSLEPVDIHKIVKAITRNAEGIANVDPYKVAVKTIGAIHDGITTQALDKLSIETAASLIPEDPSYSKLAAALLAEYIRKEVASQLVHSFSMSITAGSVLGLISDSLMNFVSANSRKLDNAVKDEYNAYFEYFGLKNVYEHHLLRDPENNAVIETPQMMFMRIAAAESKSVKAAVERYKHIAQTGHPHGKKDWFLTGTKQWKETIEASISTTIEVIEFRPLKPGMGQAVAERTILRRKDDGSWENWGDVAERVARGNASLASTASYSSEDEYRILRKHLANANTLMSGRHLQHGDDSQKTRNQGSSGKQGDFNGLA